MSGMIEVVAKATWMEIEKGKQWALEGGDGMREGKSEAIYTADSRL